MTIVLNAFVVVFFAELADKSRIAALILTTATRQPVKVFIGMTLGYLLLDGIAVAAGAALPARFDPVLIRRMAGILFIVIGAATILMGEKGEESANALIQRWLSWGALTVSFLVTAISELGDRTQIACAMMAAGTGRPISVLLGAMAAMALLNLATVFLGEALTKRLSLHRIRQIGGWLFILLGIAMSAGV